MSYEIVKSFKIDLKNLTIQCKYSPSNVTDYRGRRVTEIYEQSFETLNDLEEKIIGMADGYLDGTLKFPPSSTFAKRVDYLAENGYTRDKNEDGSIGFSWHYMTDTKEVREVLTGRKKIQIPFFAFIVKAENSLNGYNMVLKKTSNGVRLIPVGSYADNLTPEEIVKISKGTRKMSKLRKWQVDSIKTNHDEWLEKYHAEVIELS